jgi:hypothetical protein
LTGPVQFGQSNSSVNLPALQHRCRLGKEWLWGINSLLAGPLEALGELMPPIVMAGT